MPIINLVYEAPRTTLRTPWPNTIAYYPLDITNTTADMSGNSYDLTNNWATFTTLNGVECVQTGSSAYLNNTTALMPSGSANRTISVRCNQTNMDTLNWILGYGQSSNLNSCKLCVYTSEYTFYSSNFFKSGSSVTTWVRALYTITWDWTTVRQYVNGSKVKEDASALNTTAVSASYPFVIWVDNVNLNSPFDWYMAEIIVEDIARTDQNISDYFDLIKSHFWVN